MKRYTTPLVMATLMLVIIISGCTTGPSAGQEGTVMRVDPGELPATQENTSNTAAAKASLEELILSEETSVMESECEARGMKGKVIVIESSSCSACKALHPSLRRIEDNLSMEFMFLDRTLTKDRETQARMRIQAKYTPTVIANCNIYIGFKPEERYLALIKNSFGLE